MISQQGYFIMATESSQERMSLNYTIIFNLAGLGRK
jgi:hypothetical protein